MQATKGHAPAPLRRCAWLGALGLYFKDELEGNGFRATRDLAEVKVRRQSFTVKLKLKVTWRAHKIQLAGRDGPNDHCLERHIGPEFGGYISSTVLDRGPDFARRGHVDRLEISSQTSDQGGRVIQRGSSVFEEDVGNIGCAAFALSYADKLADRNPTGHMPAEGSGMTFNRK